MSASERPKIPDAQIVYGEVVYWITIVAAIFCMVGPVIAVANIDNNVLNPHFLFQAIFEGKTPEVIWEEVGGGFPGGHFYKDNLFRGDGFSQLGLALGCSAALWALLCTAVAYLKDRVYLYTILALWVSGMVILSAVGITRGH
ncbi:MAG: hypothetical protein JRD68_03940 [Deltaproteobacteria bacterium]|nr:hypothetical protein [Deltaproteobacteria bacterium]